MVAGSEVCMTQVGRLYISFNLCKIKRSGGDIKQNLIQNPFNIFSNLFNIRQNEINPLSKKKLIKGCFFMLYKSDNTLKLRSYMNIIFQAKKWELN